MVTRNLLSLSRLALNSAAQGQAPDWVQLTPAGPLVEGRDGRSWTLTDADAVVAAFAANAADIPVDFEHATHVKGDRGEFAPACGWIRELEARNGALWGRVEWLAQGAEAVASRAYRYLSPVFRFDPATKAIRRMVSAGLTNNPNLHLAALNSEGEPDLETMMDKAVLEALGLTPTATAAEAVLAINRLKQAEATALNRASQPDPTSWVPRADHQLALNRIATFEAAEKTRADKDAEAAVDAAIAGGKIAPASRDYHLATCRAEGGLERFKGFVETAPAIASPSGLEQKKPGQGAGLYTEEQLAVCRQLGLDPAETYGKDAKE